MGGLVVIVRSAKFVQTVCTGHANDLTSARVFPDGEVVFVTKVSYLLFIFKATS